MDFKFDTTKARFDESAKFFGTFLQQFQFYSKYSRYNYDLQRRETWPETVDRTVEYLKELSLGKLPDDHYERIRDAILNMKVMPSMRLLSMAGAAVKAQGVSLYNCAYLPIDSIDSFHEALTISLAGTGVGYSVESRYVSKLPVIAKQIKFPGNPKPQVFVVDDSALGWAMAFKFGLEQWWHGNDVVFDYSYVRPAGAVLKTKGGRASGPEPLKRLLNFARDKILSKQGSVLTTLDAHDIMTMVADVVLAGGVRRSAMLALFDWDDEAMLTCKNVDNIKGNEHRWNANNSIVWPNRHLTQREVALFVTKMLDKGTGEPGIFNRRAILNRDPAYKDDYGTNPCGEVILRPYQFCNLASIVARYDDTTASLAEKAEIATMIATIQSLETNFVGLRDMWRFNAEDERLIAVDLNGQLDSPVAQREDTQVYLRHVVFSTNKRIADMLGINHAPSVTTVKPSGNSSLLLDASSGIHARFSQYYIRNVRVNVSSPLYKLLRNAGVPMSPENGQTENDATTYVIHVPVKTPGGSFGRYADTISTERQLEYWKQVKLRYATHNPSVTISYDDNDFIYIAQWVYANQDIIGGMTFFPRTNTVYKNAPYIAITQEEYEQMIKAFPSVDFSKLTELEHDDMTEASQTLACFAGEGCEL